MPTEQKTVSKSAASKSSRNAKNAQAPSSNFMRSAVMKSVLLHGSIVAALLVSFNFSAKPLLFVADLAPSQDMNIVQATFIDSNVIEQKKREKAQSEAQAAAKRRQEQLQKQQREDEIKRKRREENARKKKQQEEQLRQEQAEQQKQNALEQARIKEQEIAQQRAKEDEMRRQLEQEMAEQLEQEQAAASQAQQRKVMSELEKYTSLITQTIMRNLIDDGGFKGRKCTLNVKLAPNGLVLEVKAIDGDNALCRAAQTAVLKPDTLPVSSDPVVFQRMRNLNILVGL